MTDEKVDKTAHRTTIVLRQDDLDNIGAISELLGGADRSEVLRRAVRCMAELMAYQEEGGRIVLQKNNVRERYRFVF